MARKQAETASQTDPEGTSKRVPNSLVIRGRAAWRDWLGRYAARRRVTQATLIDPVLAESAQRDGFPAPPPRYGAGHRGLPGSRMPTTSPAS